VRGARVAALDMLARRDHASSDLERKLRDLGYDMQLVGEVLERLRAEKLLDDQRYVDNFIRYHAGRGQGPLRVRAKLRQAGLQGPLVDDALDAYPDWLGRARAVRNKKFGAKAPGSPMERARQARFLGYRGFTSAEIRGALGLDIELGPDDEDL
jgi:regulatory protein